MYRKREKVVNIATAQGPPETIFAGDLGFENTYLETVVPQKKSARLMVSIEVGKQLTRHARHSRDSIVAHSTR